MKALLLLSITCMILLSEINSHPIRIGSRKKRQLLGSGPSAAVFRNFSSGTVGVSNSNPDNQPIGNGLGFRSSSPQKCRLQRYFDRRSRRYRQREICD